MGCDIHLHGEVKINGKWEHLTTGRSIRNYALFAKMAGVRNAPEYNITPISEPKGLPDDCSSVTIFDYSRWIGDAHSASWFSSKEIKELEEWWFDWRMQWTKDWKAFEDEVIGGYLFGYGWDDIEEAGVEDARIVFWFDN